MTAVSRSQHVDANGEIMGRSEKYTTAQATIDRLVSTISDLRSEKYTTAQARDNGIQSVLREAPVARVQDIN